MIIQETLENKIEVMVSEIIADDADLFLVKVVLKGNVGNQKLIILLDGDSGVNIDQCSKVSRKLAAMLEEKE
ncbi:MAG: ribosome maturation factor RimP, partial [Marinoscillum sp.]